MTHEHAGKRMRIGGKQWFDEFPLSPHQISHQTPHIAINAGSELTPVAWLTGCRLVVWRLLKFVAVDRYPRKPLLWREVKTVPLEMYENVYAPNLDDHVFCLSDYSHVEWTDANAAVQVQQHRRKIIPDYPHVCPRCGKAAYLGFARIVCSTAGCDGVGKKV